MASKAHALPDIKRIYTRHESANSEGFVTPDNGVTVENNIVIFEVSGVTTVIPLNSVLHMDAVETKKK